MFKVNDDKMIIDVSHDDEWKLESTNLESLSFVEERRHGNIPCEEAWDPFFDA